MGPDRWWLMPIQAAGLAAVVAGVADWSVSAAKVVTGLVVVWAAEMWARGSGDDRP